MKLQRMNDKQAQDINYVVALQAQIENAQLRENLRTAWAVIGILLETEHLGERRPFLAPLRQWWGKP